MAESKTKQLPACPVETTLTLIGDKWKVLILRDLMPGAKGIKVIWHLSENKNGSTDLSVLVQISAAVFLFFLYKIKFLKHEIYITACFITQIFNSIKIMLFAPSCVGVENSEPALYLIERL